MPSLEPTVKYKEGMSHRKSKGVATVPGIIHTRVFPLTKISSCADILCMFCVCLCVDRLRVLPATTAPPSTSACQCRRFSACHLLALVLVFCSVVIGSLMFFAGESPSKLARRLALMNTYRHTRHNPIAAHGMCKTVTGHDAGHDGVVSECVYYPKLRCVE